MSKSLISTGINPNDGNGDTLLAGATKVNSNFNEVYNAIGDGSNINVGSGKTVLSTNSSGYVGVGTTNATSSFQVYDGPAVIGTAASTGTANQRLQVFGGAYVSGNLGVGNTNPQYNLHIIGTTDPAGMFFDAYGNVAANIAGRRANGTLASPTGVTTSDNLLVLQGGGYATGVGFTNAKAAIFIQASEVWTSTAQGSHIDFATTLPGTISRSNKLRIDGYGNILVGSSSSTGTASQPLQVTGGAYFSGSVGIGTTTPIAQHHVVGNQYVTGIATVGLAATSLPPSNSQMTFELLTNTKLRIKVRGTDGVLRMTDLTLS